MKAVVGTYSPAVEQILTVGFLVFLALVVCLFLYSIYRALRGK